MAKHSRKSIFAVVLTLCIALCLGIFAACGDDDDNGTPTDQPVTYTVTVMKDATTPAEGVKVTVKKGSAAYAPKTTGADGKVTFELVPDSYEIVLSNIPEHYVAPSGLALTKDNQNVTFTLEEKPKYTVKLVNPDGTPYYASGVMVGVCDDESCRTPVAINEQGVAEIEEQTGDYHVQIQGLPADRGYKWISSTAANYYSEEEFKNDVTEMTITIYPVTVIEKLTPMTADEKTAYADENWSASFKSGSTAYKVNVTIPADGSAYYSITPERSGKYKCYFANQEALSYLYYGTNFANNGEIIDSPVLEAGKTYYLGFNNTDTESAMDVEFVIEAPVASYHEVTSAQNVTARVDNADAYAVIELKLTEAGAYKATAQGEQTAVKTIVNEYMLDYVYFDDDEDYGKDSACNIRFTNDMLGSTVYIVVSVKAEANEYPATLTVKLEKTNDLKDTTTVVEVEQKLTTFADQAGMELIPIELDGSETIYYDEANGYYRLGDGDAPKADDPIIVVMLNKDLDPDRLYLENAKTLIYLEMQTNGRVAPYVFDVTEDEDKESLEKGNSYTDYRTMLRGFAEYTKTANTQGGYTLSVPDKMDVDEYYAKYVNSDGVYPLTKELEAYLKHFVEYANEYAYNNFGRLLIPDGDENWMFACYYYGVGLTDDIIGEYEDEEGNTLTVKSNGRYIMTLGDEVYGGKWSYDEDGGDFPYTFKESAAFMPYTYSVARNEDTGELVFWESNNFGEDPDYTFNVLDPNRAKALYKLTTVGDNYSNAKLELFDDNSFKLSTGRFGVELSVDGTYTLKDGNLTINVANKYADSLTDVTATYKDGVITVVLTYTYEAEEEGGEDTVVKVTYEFTIDDEE